MGIYANAYLPIFISISSLDVNGCAPDECTPVISFVGGNLGALVGSVGVCQHLWDCFVPTAGFDEPVLLAGFSR